jgi:hypothetical protein
MPETFTIENVEAIRETEKGLLARWDGPKGPNDRSTHWLPKSQIKAASEVRKHGDRGTLIVTRWFAETAKLLGGKS